MKRLVLLLLLAGALTWSIPELRGWAAPVVRPVADVAVDGAEAAVDLFANSIFRWSVQRELRGIASELDAYMSAGEPLPSPARFPRFLRRNRLGGSIDPWGMPYFLRITRDSIHVGSTGPDTTRGTADDVLAGLSRRRR